MAEAERNLRENMTAQNAAALLPSTARLYESNIDFHPPTLKNGRNILRKVDVAM